MSGIIFSNGYVILSISYVILSNGYVIFSISDMIAVTSDETELVTYHSVVL